MNVLKVRHVLADDEEVILPLVHGLEFENRFTRAWMEDAEAPLRRFACLHDGRLGRELEPVVAHVERGTAHERHAAARTAACNIERVVGVHRAHECRGFCIST